MIVNPLVKYYELKALKNRMCAYIISDLLLSTSKAVYVQIETFLFFFYKFLQICSSQVLRMKNYCESLKLESDEEFVRSVWRLKMEYNFVILYGLKFTCYKTPSKTNETTCIPSFFSFSWNFRFC